MLKIRLKGDRLVATPEQRSELLRLGALLDHDVSGLLLAIKPEMLIHDADTKFCKSFKSAWAGQGVQCKQIAHGAPMQNAFAENFIGTIKRECLNHIIKVWLKHYHTSRPHRRFDIGNRVLDEQFKVQPVGHVQCREQLGGLIKDYYREAA